MARVSSLARIVPASLIPASAATLLALGVVAAPTSASAEFKLPQCFPQCGKAPTLNKVFIPKYGYKYGYGNKFGYGGGYKYDNGWGYGAAALGGMAVGLVAASAASANAGAGQESGYAGECYLARRRAVDEDGNVYIRRVRVCE